MLNIFKKWFDFNEKELDRMRGLVVKINEYEDKVRNLLDEDFPKKTLSLKSKIAGKSEIEESILIEAFALAREAARRVLGERHFDEQLLAGIALHEGKIAEQKTGEGKTLSATTALYLNSLVGRGVHLVTVNDYLARRDAGWMGRVYHFLGVTTSAIIGDEAYIFDPSFEEDHVIDWRLQHMRPISRKEAYLADITYGINSEFGFDYLRDNMANSPDRLVQRDFFFAVIDEVDSVLIDEARTPHIISAPYERDVKKYYDYARLVKQLDESHYNIDEKLRTAHLNEAGLERLEALMGIENIYEKDFDTVFHVEAALKAQTLFKIDKDYIVNGGEVVIVDEFTGRLLPGRRFSEGIHQALEAKENVAIQQESKTLATVSLQNYFRMYEKLSGMTGTAATEAEEFHKIYKLDTLVIPTHRKISRLDQNDLIYKTENGKFTALAKEIQEIHAQGRPVLVGTTSIEKNEILGSILKRFGIKHELLNAKNHEKEASIISKAGEKGAVTIATNMAGRGVDIILGGQPPNRYEIKAGDKKSEKEYQENKLKWQQAHDEVVSLGGLYVIGTERHESRRIDNQLRGRAGRQGDPGETRFFVSLEDDMMRIFGGEQVSKLMTFFNIAEDQPLEHGLVSKALEQAQVKVETFNFDSRKHLVEFDDVLNKQREIFYEIRKSILGAENATPLMEAIRKMILSVVRSLLTGMNISPSDDFDNTWLLSELASLSGENEKYWEKFLFEVPLADYEERIVNRIDELITQKMDKVGVEQFEQISRWLGLETVDEYWTTHLTAIEDMRSGINLRAYAQLDPLVEYKNEAYGLFEGLLSNVRYEYVRRLLMLKFELVQPESADKSEKEANYNPAGALSPYQAPTEEKVKKSSQSTLPAKEKIGRNDPCPCGAIDPNTKKVYKYKKCGLINAPYHKG